MGRVVAALVPVTVPIGRRSRANPAASQPLADGRHDTTRQDTDMDTTRSGERMAMAALGSVMF
ncbi:hypothetical protein IAQ61_005681 [Plenodomus lingam]|uniref:uncharacterized protein n=1 Tax=Leptosphaeria maculans TaxID=5022 RepID=UPI0033306C12|nr:hypothetical protein IAQ61_005681 [Plenodomus lingam]